MNQYNSIDDMLKSVKALLEANGINSNVLMNLPIRKHTGSSSFYQSGKSPFISLEEDKATTGTLLHESLHHIQNLLSNDDKLQLRELIKANLPEGTQGFTNYPNSGATKHHQVTDDWALAAYSDIATGYSQPYSQMFRSDEDQGKYKDLFPEPIRKFLSSKFPYIPTSKKTTF